MPNALGYFTDKVESSDKICRFPQIYTLALKTV